MISRRRLFHFLATAGASAAAFPLPVRQAGASCPADGKNARMVAAIFFESYTIPALRKAHRFAGDNGFVASMPQLLHARAKADYDNIIWNTWFTTNSEESVVTTPQGNHVVVTVHGGGVFTSPERVERSLRADLARANPEGLTGQYAAKITAPEASGLLAGRLPDGNEIPVYPISEFRQGVPDLPMRYGVIQDFETVKKSPSGYVDFNALLEDPNMMVRAGGNEPLAAYLQKARDRNHTKSMGNSHRFDAIDPAQPQTRVLKLGGNKGGVGSDAYQGWGYGQDWGLSAGGLVDMARYVAVAPLDVSAGGPCQCLDFEFQAKTR